MMSADNKKPSRIAYELSLSFFFFFFFSASVSGTLGLPVAHGRVLCLRVALGIVRWNDERAEM